MPDPVFYPEPGMSLLHFDILDHVAVPIFVLRPAADGRVTYAFWNSAAERISGRLRADVLGRTALDLYNGAFGENAYERHRKAMETGEPATYEVMLDIAGVPREVQTTLAPIKSYDGSTLVVIGTSVVVSALRAAQQRELETLAMIEATRSEMESYLAFAAHDLRSPMRQVAGLVEMMQEELPESADEAREIAAMLEQVSAKAQGMIGEVLNFNEAVNASAGAESIDLGSLCTDIFTVLDPRRGHLLTSDEADLYGDKVALQIVLRNLVDNALKHGGKARMSVHIGVMMDDDRCWITVQDDGPGLPDDQMQFIEGKRFSYGNGFGLLGVRRLVQLRQGELIAEQPDSGGTRFRLCLPGTLPRDMHPEALRNAWTLGQSDAAG